MARTTIKGVLVAATVIVTACNPFPETWQWNQKLTVEVIAPEGVRSGSAVTQVRWQEANAVGNYPTSFTGEATVVEVLPGRYLFALLGENTRYIAMRTFEKEIGGVNISPSGFESMSRIRGTQIVPRQRYPRLVTFNDIDDPSSVREVDPDNLAASFGSGVALKRITLEITDEAVTQGKIEEVLTWWCRLRTARSRLNGQTGAIQNNDLSNNLGSGSFRVGDCT